MKINCKVIFRKKTCACDRKKTFYEVVKLLFSFKKIFAEKKLFTPGPLCCPRNVKEAMLYDLGSRDSQFIDCVQEIRDQLVDIAEVSMK